AVARSEERRTRAFEFRFRGSTFRCKFADASLRLLAIANAFHPAGPPSPTFYRNLPFLQRLQHSEKDGADSTGMPIDEVPTSLWIPNFGCDENGLADLARHLNFFTGYFDLGAPQIAVHRPEVEPSAAPPRLTYPYGPFPSVISGKQVDPYLLMLWESA